MDFSPLSPSHNFRPNLHLHNLHLSLFCSRLPKDPTKILAPPFSLTRRRPPHFSTHELLFSLRYHNSIIGTLAAHAFSKLPWGNRSVVGDLRLHLSGRSFELGLASTVLEQICSSVGVFKIYLVDLDLALDLCLEPACVLGFLPRASRSLLCYGSPPDLRLVPTSYSGGFSRCLVCYDKRQEIFSRTGTYLDMPLTRLEMRCRRVEHLPLVFLRERLFDAACVVLSHDIDPFSFDWAAFVLGKCLGVGSRGELPATLERWHSLLPVGGIYRTRSHIFAKQVSNGIRSRLLSLPRLDLTKFLNLG
jgi:hypothetical protein